MEEQQSATTIHGKRVVLRPLAEGDLEKALRGWTPELRHMYGGSLTSPRRPTVEDKRRRYQELRSDPRNHCFAIEAEAGYIGFTVLQVTDEQNRKARYRIAIENVEYWGRGYGPEVARLMLRYAFETLGLHRVELRVAAYNTRAIRCYEKSGFHREGVERQSFCADGKWEDDVLMAILQHEWAADREGAGETPD